VVTLKIENLQTLQIHKLTKEQYLREKEAGNLDGSALYLTPVNTETGNTLEDAKKYTDTEIAEWVGITKVSEQITTAVAAKADRDHDHNDEYYTEAEIDSKLSGKANSNHGTHVTYGTSTTTLGTASAGSASTVSRSDHVHALPALTSCTGMLTVDKGGTGATDGANGLKNLFAAGDTVLSAHQYGTTLPSPGTVGRIYLKKVQ
jgi:hypothetical protein